MSSVLIYTKDNCPHCVSAKNLLSLKGQVFTEVKIGEGILREEFLEAFPHVKTVPHIIIDGQEIGGFDKLKEHYENGKQFLAG